MAAAFEIRSASMADMDVLGTLWLDFFREQAALDERYAVSDDALDRWRNDYPAWIERGGRYILIAESVSGSEEDADRAAEVVGFATAVRSSPPPVFAFWKEVYLEEMFVVPAYRQHGVGRQLFEEMSKWGASWGAERLRLSVLAANEAARHFWQKMGLSDVSVSMAAPISGKVTGAAEPEARKPGRIGFVVGE